MKPFDVTQHVHDDAGNPIWYINHPLDEKYVDPPGELVLEGMLPPQEFEVRRALVELKLFTEMAADYGFLRRLLNRPKYLQVLRIATEKQQVLRELVNSSPEHKAALRRIVNAMPERNGGREVLASYLV
jgi:hypothetical protein